MTTKAVKLLSAEVFLTRVFQEEIGKEAVLSSSKNTKGRYPEFITFLKFKDGRTLEVGTGGWFKKPYSETPLAQHKLLRKGTPCKISSINSMRKSMSRRVNIYADGLQDLPWRDHVSPEEQRLWSELKEFLAHRPEVHEEFQRRWSYDAAKKRIADAKKHLAKLERVPPHFKFPNE